MEKYKVIVPAAVRKDVDKIADRNTISHIAKKLLILRHGMRAIAGCRKLTQFKGRNFYRFRQGDYRVVFAVDKKSRRINIIGVGPRATIYKTISTRT